MELPQHLTWIRSFKGPLTTLSVCVCVFGKFASGCEQLFVCVHTCACIGCSLFWSSPLLCIVILLLAGVWSSHPVLWALLRGEPVWASALTARPAKLWSRTWWDQECLQQQEHLSALPLALLPVLQELSHFPLQILHLWTACPAYWKVSIAFSFPLLKFYQSLWFKDSNLFLVLQTGFAALTFVLSDYFLCSQAHLSLHANCAIPLHSQTTHSSAGELKVMTSGFLCLLYLVWHVFKHAKLNPPPTGALMLSRSPLCLPQLSPHDSLMLSQPVSSPLPLR